MTVQGSQQWRILLIHNNPDISEPLAFFFGEQGSEVISCNTAQEGIRLASRRRPDIILLGAVLPDSDGLEAFKTLRSAPLTTHIPIMFIVDYASIRRQNTLLSAGADDVIAVPFDMEIVALRIRNAIQRTRREGLTESRTGLPTGNLIADKQAQVSGEPGWAQLDISVAHFSAFLTRYDFMTGNDVLRYAASTITDVALETGGESTFVGHYRDAEFVVFIKDTDTDALTETLENRLNAGLRQFYTFVERDQGHILVEDGVGGLRECPLMNLNIVKKDPVQS